MARHRNVRNLDFHEERDYDDVYGRSLEEDVAVSPATAAQFIYPRDRDTGGLSLSSYMKPHPQQQQTKTPHPLSHPHSQVMPPVKKTMAAGGTRPDHSTVGTSDQSLSKFPTNGSSKSMGGASSNGGTTMKIKPAQDSLNKTQSVSGGKTTDTPSLLSLIMGHNKEPSGGSNASPTPTPVATPSLWQLINNKPSSIDINAGSASKLTREGKPDLLPSFVGPSVAIVTEPSPSNIISQHGTNPGLSPGSVVTLGDIIGRGRPITEVVSDSHSRSSSLASPNQIDGSSPSLVDMINAHQNLTIPSTSTQRSFSLSALNVDSAQSDNTLSVKTDQKPEASKSVPPGFKSKPLISNPFSLAELIKQQQSPTISSTLPETHTQTTLPETHTQTTSPQPESSEHGTESLSLSQSVESSLSLTEKSPSNNETIVVVCEGCSSSMVGVVLANTKHNNPFVCHRRSQQVLKRLRRRYFGSRRFNFSTPSPDDYIMGRQQKGFK